MTKSIDKILQSLNIYLFKLNVNYKFFIELHEHKFSTCTWNLMYNLWHHHFQYDILFKVYIYSQIIAHVFEL
jgi:hypothetical protein